LVAFCIVDAHDSQIPRFGSIGLYILFGNVGSGLVHNLSIGGLYLATQSRPRVALNAKLSEMMERGGLICDILIKLHHEVIKVEGSSTSMELLEEEHTNQS
jgi:hypothetical protein